MEANKLRKRIYFEAGEIIINNIKYLSDCF